MFFQGKQALCSQVRTCLLNRGVGVYPRCVSWGLATSALSKKGWSELGERRGGGLIAAVGEIVIAEFTIFQILTGECLGIIVTQNQKSILESLEDLFFGTQNYPYSRLLVGNNVPCPCSSLGVWGHFLTQIKACNLYGISIASI